MNYIDNSKYNALDNTTSVATNKVTMLKKNRFLIEAIRRCKTEDKSFIARTANISWPTVKTFLSKNTGDDELIAINNGKYELNPSYAFFLGIAVGALETKVTIVNLNFDGITSDISQQHGLCDFFDKLREIDGLDPEGKEKYACYNKTMVCYKTKNSLDYISYMCNEILRTSINYFSKQNSSSLLGIGITFPGIIDKKDLKIRFSPNISSLNGVCLLQLLHADLIEEMNLRSISLCIAHDTAAIAVFEKENLYKNEEIPQYSNMENIVCLYAGMGIGCGIIINNQLLSGKNNSIGEIGHIPGPSLEDSGLGDDIVKKMKTTLNEACYCGHKNCLEKLFRINVFNAATPEELMNKTSDIGYLNNFQQDHTDQYLILKFYLKYMFTVIINLFNPDLIVLSGRILNSIPALKSDAYILKQSSGIYLPASDCCVVNGSDRPDCVAVGAGILAYYKLIESNGKNDVSGMDFNVRWNKVNE